MYQVKIPNKQTNKQTKTEQQNSKVQIYGTLNKFGREAPLEGVCIFWDWVGYVFTEFNLMSFQIHLYGPMVTK